MKFRIYADFNNCDATAKVRLNTVGSLVEIEKCTNHLRTGQTVVLFDEELEVDARLEYDAVTGIWLAQPDWNTRLMVT